MFGEFTESPYLCNRKSEMKLTLQNRDADILLQ